MSLTALESKNNASNFEATRKWVDSQANQALDNAQVNCEDDLESIASSVIESSDSESTTDGTDTETDVKENVSTTQTLGTPLSYLSETAKTSSLPNIDSLAELLKAMNSVQTVGNVKVENSTGVHIGNITNINGNIQIIHKRSDSSRRRRRKKDCCETTAKPQRTGAPVEKEEQVQRDAFIDKLKIKVPKDLCPIIPRHQWLAQVPLEEYEYMETPVKLVVISHTATESSQQQAINIRIIRDTQCFHIESRGWNDIAYNFLIGCDGNVYQGRDWGVVGAHTQGYNTCSIGISFIGCFMRDLPTNAALNACRNLLKRGVDEGHLAVDYKLICHCQCRPTQSPGRKLFEEIKTWEHFYNIQDEIEDEKTSANS